MADQEKAKSGIVPLVLGLVIVTVIGLGAGFGLSKMFFKPDATPPAATAAAAAPAKPGADPHAKPEAHGETHGDAKAAGKAEPPPETQAAAASDLNPADLKDVVLTPFAPITANIAMPDTVWIRLEGSMAVKPNEGTKPVDVVQLASNKIVAYVKTLKLVDIQGPVGFLALSSDLNEIVRSATDGQARSVLISGFIVE
jgi:flagellar FliL protein